MIVTHLLRYFTINIFGETAYPPSVDIDRTLLKMIRSDTRVHAQPPSVELPPQFASGSSSSFANSYFALMN